MDDDFFDDDFDASIMEEIGREIPKKSNNNNTGCLGAVILIVASISSFMMLAIVLIR